jgi:hypothetical protein
MHEQQRRGAAPLMHEMQRYSSAAAGLWAATSFC